MQKKEESAAKRILTPHNFLQTCRICFANEDLFDTKTSMFEDQTVDELFSSFISAKELNIAGNYAHVVYPQFICIGCIKNLVHTRLFVDQCRKAHKTLSKVYAYLTLYQHESVVISKPVHIYKTINAIIKQRCKLNPGAPKITPELEKVYSSTRKEIEVLNDDAVVNFTASNVRNAKFRLRSKRKIVPDTSNTVASKIRKRISKKNERPKLNEPESDSTTDQNQQNSSLNDEINRTKAPRVRKPVIISKKTSETPSVENQEENVETSNASEVSNNFGENILRIINCLDPVPADFFETYDCNSKNQSFHDLHAMHLANLRKRQDIELFPTQNNILEDANDNTCQEQELNKNDSICQSQQLTDVTDSKVIDSIKNDSTCQNDVIVSNIKEEPPEEEKCEEIENADESQALERMDTVNRSRALADINRDRRNIDADHSYTNMNVFSNVRYIMPRLNFQRVNDLLYPAPDVARKKDVVLAGNINKRMASILSGISVDKSEAGVGDSKEELNLPKNYEDDGTKVKEIKSEPMEEDNLAPYDYITPDYVLVESDDFNVMHMIKQEPSEEFEYNMEPSLYK